MTYMHTHIHVYVLIVLFWKDTVVVFGTVEKKAYTESLFLSLPLPSIFFYLLGCSLPLNAGPRSHYVLLISVADSGGTVRDCRGRREEGERRNEAYGCESEHTTPNCTDRA